MFVPVLATCTRTRVPRDAEYSSRSVVPSHSGGNAIPVTASICEPTQRISPWCSSQHSDGDGRGVHATAAFGGRHALDAVTAGFMIQAIDACAINLKAERRDQSGLSAITEREALVGADEIGGEQACVGATFSSADFNRAAHDSFSGW